MQFYIPEILRATMDGMEANPPAFTWKALCALSCTALAVTVHALKLDRAETGEMEKGAKQTAEIESGELAALQGLEPSGVSRQSATAMDAVQRRTLRASSRRLWTREDGFTMSRSR